MAMRLLNIIWFICMAVWLFCQYIIFFGDDPTEDNTKITHTSVISANDLWKR